MVFVIQVNPNFFSTRQEIDSYTLKEKQTKKIKAIYKQKQYLNKCKINTMKIQTHNVQRHYLLKINKIKLSLNSSNGEFYLIIFN